jgi:hypothetical protein
METVVAALNTLLATKKISALEGEKIATIQKYVFDTAETPLRIQVAETVFRQTSNRARKYANSSVSNEVSIKRDACSQQPKPLPRSMKSSAG